MDTVGAVVHSPEKAAGEPGCANAAEWYAAYTRCRHEKHVVNMLDVRGVEHYLPLYESVHVWKDRRAQVQLPLFPGYVFVHIPLADRMRVLTAPGVIRLVGNPAPAPLPAFELEAIRNYISQRLPAEPYPYITRGKRVRIKAGSLQGLEGIVVRRKSTCRVVINLDLIMRSMAVEVAMSDLEVIASRVGRPGSTIQYMATAPLA